MSSERNLEKPIIFIGTGRSGSTVISGAVMSHSDLGYPSNYQHKFPRFLGINLVRRFFDNALWRVYTRGGKHNLLYKLIFLPSEAYAMWKHLVGERIDFSRSYLLEEKATAEETKFIRAYFSKMLKLQGKKRLVFKITGPSRIGYLLSIFPDAQFVYITRGYIPTLSSFLKVGFWKSRGYDKLWFLGPYSKQEEAWIQTVKDQPEVVTAFQLKRLNDVADFEIEKHQPSVIRYQYEDFTQDPELAIKTILDFLGLTYDSACFRYLEKNKIYHREKDDTEYFPLEVLREIRPIFQKQWMGKPQ